jgi:hypothetical protein
VTSGEAAVMQLLASVATEAGVLDAVVNPTPKPERKVTCPSCGEEFAPRG